jgi:PHD/YefM family antitoxin component YafN of YafNO toxin-antitoxin module
MDAITIPRKLVRQGDLVIVPRKEYEALKELSKTAEFAPTAAQRKALAKAEQNLKAGKTLSYYELVRKLEFAD